MPSPLNTPTSELMPNQLGSDMSGLEWSTADNSTIKDIEEDTHHCPQRQTLKRADISETSQTSDIRRTGRSALNLDLNRESVESNSRKKPVICFGKDAEEYCPEVIDVSIALEKQSWFHGYINRTDAENVLRECRSGSYLVRRCHTSKQHYSLSLKCVRGFMHIKMVGQSDGGFTLGTSNLSFPTIPHLISHYGSNRLPIRGAEHMPLLFPVVDQLL